MEELIRLEHVSYAYDGGQMALRDCSVTVRPGEKIAVLGNNGAGKSTFFLLANGVLRPKEGTIYLEKAPVGRSQKELTRLRRQVGLVFQEPDTMIVAGTVEEEISFGPMNLGLEEPEVRRRVEDAIAHFGLEAFRQRAPQYLSGGEKKRVTLADALAMEPKLLLLDEPAASLDPANTRLLEENLEQLSARGIALMVATHDVDFAWRWAERVLLFHQGQLMADCPAGEAFGNRALLDLCGLEQPILYGVGTILGLDPPPKTLTQLRGAMRP